jgi:tripartite-type tricarboxylate transporter receptor subunit TctC
MLKSRFAITALFGLCAASALAFAATTVAAQEKFPSRTIEVITHAGAGGGTDIMAQMMMREAREILKADMALANKRGGGGSVAHAYVSQRPADGYTLLTFTGTQIATIVRGKSAFKSIDDLIPIARGTSDPQFIMVSSKSAYKTPKDFIDAHKTKSIKYGIASVGGGDHITTWQFTRKLGVKDPAVVPLVGGGDITIALVGGNVDAGILNYQEAEAQIKAGEVRPLIVLSEKRQPAAPDVPTAKEIGVDYSISTVRGWMVRKGTPPERVKILREALLKAMSKPSYQEYLKNVGAAPDSVGGYEEWGRQIQNEAKDTAEALTALGLMK